MKLSLRKTESWNLMNLRLMANQRRGLHYLSQPLCNDLDTRYISGWSVCVLLHDELSISNTQIDVFVLLAAYVYARGESCDLYFFKVCPYILLVFFAISI
jgi:hypothetical protein